MSNIRSEAEQFLNTYYEELGLEGIANRISEVIREIERTGTYRQTEEELTYGAKLAWRNSNRCIGRLAWEQLHVIDARDAATREDVIDVLLSHIEYATNGGRIRSTLTVLPETVHLLNHQLIRYAGYESEEGVIGDPASLALTELCESLGWRGARTDFDVLPLVIEIDGVRSLHEIPEELVLEVDIIHPEHDLFGGTKIKWYAVPMISDMILEIGGIRYPCAPFNGWYMGTEIGARNLADADRYDLLPTVARSLGLNTSKDRTLWKDRALIELNGAVLDSFERAGITIVDHHTAARQFARFEKNENACGRDVTGEWAWLVPPISGASTHMFHKDYSNETKRPNFFPREAVPVRCPFSMAGERT
ncbi:nitric oxide synthase oxygenase [Exiguobacterium flavidum]|uniref:nitric oxide synthase oxygenase n=1 Tax=Exiguobacterium flavidum TaxID=2184695 RepID=UPI000DF79457|nr:nitric oxide synthase oxygenase [Exiguobacterium flavidum]